MRALIVREPGGPDALVVTERAAPVPGPEEILVGVAAAGVNRADVMQRMGKYPPPPGAPDIPGLEISGVVAQSGPSVVRWKEGDRVVALVAGGGYAEYCAVHETNALPLPQSLSFVEGAGLPEATFTVWHNVFQRGRLGRGEWLLVHGGTSGIGTTAIQLAKALGRLCRLRPQAPTKNAARPNNSGPNAQLITKRTISSKSSAKVTRGHGADVILDMVGGDYLDRNIMERRGRWPHRANFHPRRSRDADGSSETVDQTSDSHRVHAAQPSHSFQRGTGTHH
jgi:NADPH:quinone reductase-like Zn-dependent oxidoreductase